MCINRLNKLILHFITEMASNKTCNGIDLIEQLLFIETKKGEFRGFKQDFLLTSLNEVEKEFYVCTKCNGIMRNACRIGEEELLVCELCSAQGDKSQSMVKSRKKILELRVKCSLERRGCEWKGTIAEIETHLNVCTEFIIECAYKCDVIMKRSELTKHCMNECENREVECQHCKSEMQYKELENHYSNCIEFPLKCPNECLKNLTRKEVELHVQNECPNTILNCTNKCGIKRIRCEMQNHCEKECQNRNINCKHCKVIIVFKEKENHDKTCPEFPLLCPNECLKGLTRKELETHIGNQCPNTTVECPYKEMGYKETMKRRDVEEHEKRYELKHLRMTVQYFSNKTDQIEKNCKSQIDQNEKNCKYHEQTCELIIEKLNTENENLKTNEKNLEIRLMGMENKVKELTEEISYPVVLRDELRIEILVEYLQSHLQDNDPQVTKERTLAKRSLFYRHEYGYRSQTLDAAMHPSINLYQELIENKPIFNIILENIMPKLSDDQETKEEFMVIYRKSFCYNQDQFKIQFEYIKAKKLIEAIIFGRRQVRAKFKLRILDRKDIHQSPVFETIISPLSRGVDAYLIAEIPKDLILKKRFRNGNRSVSFTIQEQEMNNLPWWYMNNTQEKK